ncbi:hypothetical protein [uncultured Chryseobacterium sp.]|uniref:hypothetical protein n=1 Tax=uncultured Chryseobacterium sp. TaxID=259322 RepID=UPI0025F5A433|nr:hypothetical protein [uncultured Chryseobacterium sp.]
MKKLIYILPVLAFLTSCESRTYEEISDNTPITAVIRYNADIKPIIESNCISCHSAASSFPLATYAQAKNNIEGILNRIQRPAGDPLKMPQGGSLSAAQINMFLKWKADGLLEN